MSHYNQLKNNIVVDSIMIALTLLFAPYFTSVTRSRSFSRINCMSVAGLPFASNNLNCPCRTKYLPSVIMSVHFCCLVKSKSDYIKCIIVEVACDSYV